MPFTIVRDDLVHMRADAIVLPSNERLVIDGGTGLAVGKKAGLWRLRRACRRIGHCPTGGAVHTRAFSFPARYMIHAVGPVWGLDPEHEEALLRSAYDAALALAAELGCESVAMPLLSAGTYGCPAEVSLALALDAISSALEDHELDVTLVLYDRKAVAAGLEEFDDIVSFIDDCYVEEQRKAEEKRRVEERRRLEAQRLLEEAERREDFDGSLGHGPFGPWGAPDSHASTVDRASSPSNAMPFASGPAPVPRPPASAARPSAPAGPSERREAPAARYARYARPPMPDTESPRERRRKRRASDRDESPRWSRRKSSDADEPVSASYAGAPAAMEEDSFPLSDAMIPASPAMGSMPTDNLKSWLSNLDEGFSVTLLKLIDARGEKDSEVYKRANVSRQLFSKIRNDPTYRPTKKTVLAFAVALELDLEETADLMSRAGLALSRADKFDMIVEYYIRHGIYDIFRINEALYVFDQPLLD